MNNNSKVKFSIITVCFNAQNSIEETLESVLIQSNVNYEYIVIDGKSTDDTYNIVLNYEKKFKERGICFIAMSEPDEGIYDAMNKGISRAKGQYINFLNADDKYISSDVLKLAASFINENKADIYIGNAYLVFNEKQGYIQKPSIGLDLLGRMSFIHQAVFISKEIQQKNLFNTAYKLAADYDFFLKAYIQKKKFKVMNINIVAYSMNGRTSKNIELSKKEIKIIKQENMRSCNELYKFGSYIISSYYNIRLSIRKIPIIKKMYIAIKQEF